MTQEQKPLNKGQLEAAEGVFKFLLAPGVNELNISGPGGVGKTYLMGYLIDVVIPRYFEACKLMNMEPLYDDVVMTATTNQAAEVLSAATGRPCQTVHSYFNLVVRENFQTGKSTLEKSKTWEVHQNVIIFVDEASQIDTPLRRNIKEGTYNCKIIYVGDHCQLGPVMEDLSPIYKDSLPFYELTEPMRTDNPHLQALNNQLRDTVKTGNFYPIRLIPGVIDQLEDAEMGDFMDQTFDIARGNVSARVLAYTNSRVLEYNDHIRAIRHQPFALTDGEFVVANNMIRIGKNVIRAEQEVQITNLGNPTTLELGNNVSMEVRYATLVSMHGALVCPLPVHRSHHQDLIKWYAKNKNWERMYWLKNNVADLRQRDASTVHKIQGSSLDISVIDVGNLSTCRNPAVAARLFYVAASRARKRIVMYGELAERFGGIIR